MLLSDMNARKCHIVELRHFACRDDMLERPPRMGEERHAGWGDDYDDDMPPQDWFDR